MPPDQVDWSDQPCRYKIYQGVERLPLCSDFGGQSVSLDRLLDPDTTDFRSRDPRTIYQELSALLLLANGVVSRRLSPNWNPQSSSLCDHMGALLARPTASGGGLYPYELYLATGRAASDEPLLPGLYHYDNAHHALAQLHAGDESSRVVEALSERAAAEPADYWLLISIQFWKNLFKYHNFGYHVVTQDAGAVVESILLAAKMLGVESHVSLWFDDEQLNALLGLKTRVESVLAVVALRRTSRATPGGPAPQCSRLDAPLVRLASYQRSKRVFTLPLVETVHLATVIHAGQTPDGDGLLGVRCDPLDTNEPTFPLPPASFASAGRFPDIVQDRHSSFGRLSGAPPISLRSLAALLRWGAGVHATASDVSVGGECPFTRLMLFAHHVQDLPRGIYGYDSARHALGAIPSQVTPRELQQYYILQNYNLEQAAAVLVLVGNVNAMLKAFGGRGYRILNAQVGQLVQRLYVGAAALGLACGALLGIDNLSLNALLRLESSQQTSLLIVLIGHERASGTWDCRLV